jgi:transcriptional regulator GlxA family with amidase domain
VPLEQIWRAAEVHKLHDDLFEATSAADAAAILERAISVRLSSDTLHQKRSGLVMEAAGRLLDANVSDVAAGLGISERHLRRVFLETAGVSPKTFARLMRFSRATDLARGDHRAGWAGIAAAAGYYDQAHLIEDFHAFAGATPEAFRRELGAAGGPMLPRATNHANHCTA